VEKEVFATWKKGGMIYETVQYNTKSLLINRGKGTLEVNDWGGCRS